MPNTRFYIIILSLSILCFASLSKLKAQISDSVKVLGYVYESNNAGFLVDVKVLAKSETSGEIIETISDPTGKFEFSLPRGDKYSILAQKRAFKEYKDSLNLRDTTQPEVVYLKYPLERLPGYMLEASISELIKDMESNGETASAYSLEGVTIEVYNNTLYKEELRLPAHPHFNFSILLEQGNEYIFMLRKEGYYTKRMRANVNVNGCILCLEGFGTVTPGVVENLTRKNTMGTLIANVSMKKIELGQAVKIDNIYYDFGSAAMRKESYEQVDIIAELMRDNPRVVVELSSHTDSRGSNARNNILSQKRAEIVVQYIQNKAKIGSDRIVAKGYGEDRPVNSCVDGVECSDEMHQQNRRTEFTVLQIKPKDASLDRSLASIMQEENMDKLVSANTETYFQESAKDSLNKKAEQKEPTIPSVIPMQFTGFMVEMMTDKNSPALDHPVFLEFSEVYLDLDKNDRFSFLVGRFERKADAESYRTKYQRKYPKSRIVEYKEGIRL